MVQKFAAIALDESAPAHFAIAVCESKKKIPIEILNVAGKRVGRMQIHRGSKNNENRRHQGSRESCLWYPPEMMRRRSALQEEKQEIHCAGQHQIEDAHSHPLRNQPCKR